MMYRKFLVFFLAFPLFGALLQAPQFSLSYDDKNWEYVPAANDPKIQQKEAVDQAMAEQTLAVLQRKNADDKYRPRISVVVDPLKKEMQGTTPLLAYQKHAVDFMKSQRFTIQSQAPKQLSIGENAVEITATQRDFGLTFRQIIFVKNDKAYLLTATTRTDKFPSYEKEIDSILASFKWSAN